jgi:hypothetical protein
VTQGKHGVHSEHLGFVLAEMQSLARAHPGPPGNADEPFICAPPVEPVWAALDMLTDPEIPVVTLRELGILRDVREGAHGLEVVITPTYSGCPAMGQIEDDVRAALAQGH